jgi:hypothetical protein
MINDSSFRRYASFWSKYRPAVLHMMQAALNELQQYQFMKHELSSIEKKPKGGFEFRLVISKSRATRESSDSEIASDLMNMLQLSQTGSALMSTNSYEITLDRKQKLCISSQSLSNVILTSNSAEQTKA